MVESPGLAREQLDPEPFPPAETAQERIWKSLEGDLASLSRHLGRELRLAH
jgi:hypothetical protein